MSSQQTPYPDELLEHGQVFRQLFERSADPMLLLDGDRFIACNQAAVNLLGYTSIDELLNARPADLSPAYQPDGTPSTEKARALLDAAHKAGSLRFEWLHQCRNGDLLPVEVLLTAVPLNGRTILHVAWRDIRARKRAYAALEQKIRERTRESEQRRYVTQGMHDILTMLNSNRPLDEMLSYLVQYIGCLLGSEAVAIYQLGPDSVLRVQVAQGFEPEQAIAELPVGVAFTGRAVLERKPITVSDTDLVLQQTLLPESFDAQHVARLAARFHAVLSLPLMIKEEVYGAITIYYPHPREFSDEDVRLALSLGDHAALAIENARLRAQIERSAIAAERSRLARDLHDAVTQSLFSASLIAEVLPRLWKRNPEEGQRRLDELRHLTRGALAEMRTLLLELRPAALMEVPLGDLLRQITEAISGRAMIPIAITIEGECCNRRDLPPEVHIALYRIAQEALNNVARHSHAQRADVTLRYHSADGRCSASLQIADDGCGFDLDQISGDHLGLDIMRERAQAAGAHLAITSAPGEGTCVAVRWSSAR